MPYEKQKSVLSEGLAAKQNSFPPATDEATNITADDDGYLLQQMKKIRGASCEILLDTQLEGVRGEYLEAFRAKIAAERRCAEGLQRVQQLAEGGYNGFKTSLEVESTSLLQRHLHLVQLQKQHSGLVELKDELEALKLSRSSSKFEVDVEQQVPDVISETVDYGSNHITGLVDFVQTRVNALEIALVRDQHEAERQAAILKKLRSHSKPSSQYTSHQRLSALLATRSELTAWLEESLEKCQEDTSDSPDQEKVNGQGSTLDDAEIERKTDQEYERYLEARKRVLLAVSALKREVPELDMENKVLHLNTDQSIPIAPRRLDSSQALTLIEQNLLSAMTQQAMTHKHSALSEEQLAAETSNVVRVIERLSDESQLLQAFPLLANSGRFQHASSVFGNRPNETSVPEDEITQHIEPWLFSAEAADIAAESAINKQVNRGKEATASVSRSLTELRLLLESN